MITSYSQAGQDIFVTIMTKGEKGTFLDLGCNLPFKINNTYLLELNDWTGISVDITNYSREWTQRKNKFIQQDCFTIDYNSFLSEHFDSKVIDYLSLDMERLGDRFKLLELVMRSDFEFKVITIEHDSYIHSSFEVQEKQPQRKLLKEKGYHLLCGSIYNTEDWWINPKYINIEEVKEWQCENEKHENLFNKFGIEYQVYNG